MSERRPGGLRTWRPRGFAAVALVAVPVLGLLAVAVGLLLTQQQREVFTSTALAETRSVLVSVPDGLAGADADELGRALRRPERLEVVLVDRAGSVAQSSSDIGIADVPAELRRDGRSLAGSPTTVDGAPYLVVGGSTGPLGPSIYLFFSERGLDRETNLVVLGVAGTWGVLVVLLVGAGWVDSHRRLRSLARRREHEHAFTAHLGHELRTPVGALVTAASLVDAEELDRSDPVLRQAVEIMQTQARRLRRIVEGLLELSRLETGQVQVRAEEVSVEEIASSTITAYGWGRVRLVVEGTTAVRADPQSMARLFLNLVGNAVRHARDEVVVTIRGSDTEVVLEIADDGEGMPAHVVERALDRTAGVTTHQSVPGQQQGLGLLIARAHVALVGARMEIDVRPGEGTTVRVHLPAASQTTSPTSEG